MQAQTFLESLFGFGDKPKARAQPRGPRRVRVPAGPRITTQPWNPWKRFDSPAPRDDDGLTFDAQPKPRIPKPLSGRYRSVCVRLCDGSFFPLGYGRRRYNLSADADRCEARCGDEGRLFYYDKHADLTTMRDLRGKAYTDLKTAFLFKKKYMPACRCQPQPWSQRALTRHLSYQLNEPDVRRLARFAGDRRALAGLAPYDPARYRRLLAQQMRDPALVALVFDGDEALPEPYPLRTGDENDGDGPARDTAIPQTDAGFFDDDEPVMSPPQIAQRDAARRAKRAARAQRRRWRRAQRRTARQKRRVRRATSSGIFGFGGSAKYKWPGD
ncbi:MAG: DUF2865 domain-containing protein [Pseudomonadota bacterium]